MKYLEFLPSDIFRKKYILSLIPRPARGGGGFSVEYYIRLWIELERRGLL